MVTTHLKKIEGCNETVSVQLPGVAEHGVLIGLDYYSLQPRDSGAERFQVLLYEADKDEPVVCVRYDKLGQIVEVQLNHQSSLRVVRDDGPATPWELERDGPATPWDLERDGPATVDPTKPERDSLFAWHCKLHADGWYWYNDQGYPQGPYADEWHARQGLDDYNSNYYDEC